jgi:Family of unknown function (DUF6029)
MRARWAALAATLLGSNAAAAAEPSDAEPPVTVEITDATTLIYAWNNRNFASGDATTVVDDNWGVWYNRLHGQVTSGAFRFGFRLDNAWFFTSPDATAAAIQLALNRPQGESTTSLPVYFRQKEQEVGQELSNRYINWVYPAKIYASYTQRSYDVTVGDSYAELGHGMVLSVRKRDELSSDDTIRGVRANGELHLGDARVRLTVLGGSLNPLRMDEGTGRYLGVDASVTRGWLALTEAGMPRAIGTDFAPLGPDCASTRTCTYAPDRVAAGQLVADLGAVTLATQGSVLVRQAALHPDAVRSATDIATVSQSATLSTSDSRGGIAVEAAEQKLAYDNPALGMPTGYGVYATGSYDLSPLVLLVEGRHYRRLFPLYANIAIDSAREFSQVAWNAPPTTEAQYIDTEFGNFATCVSGGRGRADYAIARGISAFGWVGYWQTFAEVAANERCVTARELRNDVTDLAAGVELRPGDSRSRATITLGARFDDSAVPQPTPDGATSAYYREVYLRYDVVQALGGPFALELHGWHRYRHEPLGPQLAPWWEGEHTTGIDYGDAWAFAVGAEYDTDIRPPTTYFNGTVRFKPTSDSSIGLFVGQRRGALRCVGGVCRVVPGLEGMRLDASVRF